MFGLYYIIHSFINVAPLCPTARLQDSRWRQVIYDRYCPAVTQYHTRHSISNCEEWFPRFMVPLLLCTPGAVSFTKTLSRWSMKSSKAKYPGLFNDFHHFSATASTFHNSFRAVVRTDAVIQNRLHIKIPYPRAGKWRFPFIILSPRSFFLHHFSSNWCIKISCQVIGGFQWFHATAIITSMPILCAAG